MWREEVHEDLEFDVIALRHMEGWNREHVVIDGRRSDTYDGDGLVKHGRRILEVVMAHQVVTSREYVTGSQYWIGMWMYYFYGIGYGTFGR